MIEDARSATNVVGYELEGPFPPDPLVRSEAATSPVSPGRAFAAMHELQTPFLTEYFHENGERGVSPVAEHYAALVDELYDQEFEEALLDLTHEAAAVAEEQFSFEAGDAASERLEAEEGLRAYFAPLAAECEAMVDRVKQVVSEQDEDSLSEGELEALLDRCRPGETSLSPVQEQFLGGFFKKVKKAAKGAAAVAKQGLSLAAKLSPIHLILERLKKLVRPLLERVLRFAIDKLPVALQPAARQLATRFLGITVKGGDGAAPAPPADTSAADAPAATPDGGGATDAAAAEPAAEDPATIQSEFDALVAGYTLQGEAFERQGELEELLANPLPHAQDRLRELVRARSRFSRRMRELKSGDDPGPVVQEFVPAILAALKLGIRIVGRPRVVRFLGDMVARLISRYTGPEQSRKLGGALVDAGLRAVSLEAETDEASNASEALAATVEDTVNRVTEAAPLEAWASEGAIEGYVYEAFERAASAHFPDRMLRPSVREAAGVSGVWVSLPPGPSKRYKKYSRVVEVSVTPQMARELKTFRGHTLHDFLRDQFGLASDATATGRLHLYEAVAGTTLAGVARRERHVRGLGHTRREAWSQFHPLTPEAAGILLREPGLGRRVQPGAMANHAQLAVGQRFYLLEVPGAQTRYSTPVTAQGGKSSAQRPAHVRQVRVVFNFPKSELRLCRYYSEAEAQFIARQARRKGPAGSVLDLLLHELRSGISALLTSEHGHGIRVVHEAVPAGSHGRERLLPVLRLVGSALARVVAGWCGDALRAEVERRLEAFAARLVQAADAEADGMTIELVFQRPPFFGTIRRAIADHRFAAPALLADLIKRPDAEVRINVHPGYRVHA